MKAPTACVTPLLGVFVSIINKDPGSVARGCASRGGQVLAEYELRQYVGAKKKGKCVMRTIYKGHEIDVRRERSMGGWTQLYYGVFRVADGYECTSGFCDTSDSTLTFTRILKDRVDAELASADPWDEQFKTRRWGYMQQRGAA
jgi:hypothetical protein